MSRKGGRRPATSNDPVAAAIAASAAGRPLIPRHPDVVPRIEELPQWIDVHDSDDIDGFNTVVWFDDEISSYCDAYDDGLDQALADQPGVEDILAEDREVVYLRTKLAIADVKAAVIRAVVEVNRSPREPAPTDVLSIDTVDRLASGVLPLLGQAGFANTPTGPRYFYREGSEGFVQSIALAPGAGTSGDGTSYAGLVWVMSGTHVPGFGRDVPSSPDRVAPVHCGQPAYHWVAPTVDALTRLLHDEVLPVLSLTRGRAEFAAWVGGDPTRVPVPNHRPTYARLFAQWGLTDQAARVVAHVDEHERSLRLHPDIVTARELIRDARP
ncbi:hypothetical protein ACIQCN_02415 [Pseudarthrobacter sp. NPDC092424]|uniref:hypothetical protein n=1 Tax=Pseudarthrobacter sp. NPDC092424 TaxID=3364415 RepID=UPI0038174692